MTPARTEAIAARPARPKHKTRYTAAWRPSWNDYAEVTMAAGETEVIAFLSRVVRRKRQGPRAAHATLSAIARAGLIGDAPGWRRALRDSFATLDRPAAAVAVAAIEHVLQRGPAFYDEKWTAFLRRAVTTSKRMGIRPPLTGHNASLGGRRRLSKDDGHVSGPRITAPTHIQKYASPT